MTAILGLIPDAHARPGDEQFAWPVDLDVAPGGMFGRARRGRADRSSPLLWKRSPNAMAVVAELGGGVREDEIKREALRLFGGKRMTTQISERLADALTVAVATRRVELAPSGAYLARF